MKNDKQAWEYNEKHTWQHNHYNKQPNNTRLTQIGHQGNLAWNHVRQTIVGEIQVSCRIKMTSKHESTMKNTHDNTIITTSNQTTIDSHKLDIKAIWLGMVLSNYCWRELMKL
jgi:hypothetical protein